jgi:uncharacterized membrane protein YdjX (TVP38/TMEM64 family)
MPADDLSMPWTERVNAQSYALLPSILRAIGIAGVLLAAAYGVVTGRWASSFGTAVGGVAFAYLARSLRSDDRDNREEEES